VSPDGEIDPLRDVFGTEGGDQGHSRSKLLLVPVLMQDKDGDVLTEISHWFFKGGFPLFEEIVEDGIFDVAESVECDFGLGAWFGDDEWAYEDRMKVEVFSKIVDVVAGLQQVADGNLAEFVGGVVVVAVDGEDGQGDVYVIARPVCPVGFSIEGHFQFELSGAEDIAAEGVQAPEEALFGGVDLVEEIPAQENEIDFLLFGFLEHLFETFEAIVSSYGMFFLVSEVDVGGDQKSDLFHSAH
jgi:hypothetical protein